MMNKKNLNEAINEATRFLKKAIELKESIKNEPDGYIYVGTAINAATKRASMDLTRALANLRKS